MSETSFPWSPPHAGSAINAAQYRTLSKAYGLQTPGVLLDELNELAVYADASGMQVKVPSGLVAAFGTIYQNDAERTLAIGSNSTGGPRYDAVVVTFDFTNETAHASVLPGNPGTTAQRENGPTLTQTSTRWDVLLAYVVVPNAAVTLGSGDVKLCQDRWASHMGDDPVGTLIDFALDELHIPGNYVAPYGQVTDRWTYPKLWAIAPGLGASSWGYSGATSATLTLPDHRGRIGLPLDNLGGSDGGRLSMSNALGATGGEEKHVLDEGELAAHTHGTTAHSMGTDVEGGHTTNLPGNAQYIGEDLSSPTWHIPVGGTGLGVTKFASTGSYGNHTHLVISGGTDGTGLNHGHNNLQPYMLVSRLLKVA